MIAYLLISIFPAALIVAALNDLYEFRIPNWLTALLFAAFPATAVAVGAPISMVIEGLIIGAVTLSIGLGLFAFRVLGGGDVKLLAALTPWLGLAAMPSFMLGMAYSTLGFIIFLKLFRRMPALPVYAHAPFLMELHGRKGFLPYAVPICGGGLISFTKIPFFQLVFGG